MPHLRPVLALAAGALVLAGCGSSSSDGGSSSTSTSTSSSASGSNTAAAPAASKAAKGPQKVAIKDFDYSPRKLVVDVGTKVTWTNKDPANHTVTFDSGSKQDLGNQPMGKSVSFVFKKAGTFKYHCDFHTNMHGTVVVR